MLAAIATDFVAATVNGKYAAEPAMVTAERQIQCVGERFHNAVPQRYVFSRPHTPPPHPLTIDTIDIVLLLLQPWREDYHCRL